MLSKSRIINAEFDGATEILLVTDADFPRQLAGRVRTRCGRGAGRVAPRRRNIRRRVDEERAGRFENGLAEMRGCAQ